MEIASASKGKPPNSHWFVYILPCDDGSLYIGSTSDVDRRFKRHSARTGSLYTKSHKVSELVYRELCSDELQARRREMQIKCWSRVKKLALIRGDMKQLRLLSKSRD